MKRGVAGLWPLILVCGFLGAGFLSAQPEPPLPEPEPAAPEVPALEGENEPLPPAVLPPSTGSDSALIQSAEPAASEMAPPEMPPAPGMQPPPAIASEPVIPPSPAPAAPAEAPAPADAPPNLPSPLPPLSTTPAPLPELPLPGQGGEPTKKTAAEKVPIEFRDIELDIVVQWVSQVTGKRFLYTAQDIRNRKINLLSPENIPPEDVFKVFQSILEFHGFTLVRVGEPESTVYKVIKVTDARSKPTPIYPIEHMDLYKNEDTFITQVYPLKYVEARDVDNALRRTGAIRPDGGSIAPIEGSNTILISDFAPNVSRVMEIIKLIDVKGPERQLKVITLKYATAQDMVQKLETLLSPDRGEGRNSPMPPMGMMPSSTGLQVQAAKLVPDARTNTVIVQAKADDIEKIERVIQQLDIEIPGPKGDIHIYRLKHAKAEELAPVLSALLQGKSLPASATAIPPYGDPNQMLPYSPGEMGMGMPDAPSTPGAGTVAAEKQTNSLIAISKPDEWDQLLKIIKELDVRKRQVLLEAAFVELSPSDTLDLGIELAGLKAPGDAYAPFGATSFGLSSLVSIDATNPSNLKPTPITPSSPGLPMGRLPNPAMGAVTGVWKNNYWTIPMLVRAMQTSTRANILSMPRLLTSDNQKANIKVGTGLSALVKTAGAGGGDTSYTPQYIDAATDMEITPTISADQYLTLDIKQKIDAFVGGIDPATGRLPNKQNRELNTIITIPDGHMVSIGGMTRTTENETVNKVPVLGDIPLIGFFFRSKNRTLEKVNVYLFLCPHIVKDEDFKDLYKLSQGHKMELEDLGLDANRFDKDFDPMEYRRNQELKSGISTAIPGGEDPGLPQPSAPEGGATAVPGSLGPPPPAGVAPPAREDDLNPYIDYQSPYE